MPALLQLVPPDGKVRARPREREIERHLARFPAKARPRLAAFAREHAWAGDLVVSFPALAAAIALGPKNATRDAAFAAVIAGAPLARVAAITNTPLWLRAAPPEAFAAAPPLLPDDADFRRSIANYMPKHWKHAPNWLDVIAKAFDVGDSAIALWFAREAPRTKDRAARNSGNERLVALYAWLCAPGHIRGSEAIPPWRAEMAWNAARAAATDWREATLLELYLLDGVADPWFEPARIGAYEFAPLNTTADLCEEAAAMSHCVRTYGYEIASNHRRIWSVRKDGARVATLSLRAPNGFMPTVDELSGPSNALVDAETAAAVHGWLSAQDVRRFPPARYAYMPATIDQTRWRAIWREWWRAKKRVPHWLPLYGSEGVLYAL